MAHEQQFLDALKSIFIGAKVEGESGYINLMKIKANYFEKGVFPFLMKDIDLICKPFEKDFREELFDKLYDFFQHYFSESGSIYFRNTAQHHNIYEKVYTDDHDVMLFWKTHMLYYVKTDRLFNSMEIEIDSPAKRKFFFDNSGMELKRSNEKRELTYTFKSIKNGIITLTVSYSEKGRKTKIDEIVQAAKDNGMMLDEEMLEKAFAVFQKQSEVDYFINKNAKAFLDEQFDLWLYQYIFKGESEFNELRLKQLQAMKSIATKIIDFIAQFEEELVKIWNKPKFVLNSNYIITLDKITDEALLKEIFKHKGMINQIAEWQELGMVDKKFNLDFVLEKNLLNEPTNPQYRYLPLDTKYFKDLELDILALFDDLDSALDGWLIHSENYQALNTILPKFLGKANCIHIDPPYNTKSSGFLYENNYGHSSWLSMMNDRIVLSKSILAKNGIFTCHIDEYEFERLNILLDMVGFQNAGTMVWDKGQPVTGAYGLATQHEYVIWKTIDNIKIRVKKRNLELIQAQVSKLLKKNDGAILQTIKDYRSWLRNNNDLSPAEKTFDSFEDTGRIYRSDNMSATDKRTDEKFYRPLIHPATHMPCPVPEYGWRYSPNSMDDLLAEQKILFGEDHTTMPRKKTYLDESETSQLPSMYRSGARGKQGLDELGIAFPFAHSIEFYEYILRSAAPEVNDIILDFFAGSGTTAHASINLNRDDGGKRKYILVEIGEQFINAILPRIKKVVFSDNWKAGIAQEGKGISHFAKYFELEQYEDALKKARYEDAPLFAGTQDAYTSYAFLRDLKMLEAVRVDKNDNNVEVNLEKLYDGIDLAETLSYLTGKWIRRITKDTVEFQDGTSANLSAPDWDDVKSLIWW
ncbi:MAG: site-specific DNA-methyltransferase [Chloroflexi bacterium HGW-Chloroflexi-6]|nr:MAG: site-specific DNA-methyltransferase [Chloroflexi bacterium HGW-Chloroflexi-6]